MIRAPVGPPYPPCRRCRESRAAVAYIGKLTASRYVKVAPRGGRRFRVISPVADHATSGGGAFAKHPRLTARMSISRGYRSAPKSASVRPVRSAKPRSRGSAVLRQYLLYELDEQSRVFKPAKSIDADNDGMAAEVAAGLLAERAIEIWQESRIVTCLKPVKSKRVSVAS